MSTEPWHCEQKLSGPAGSQPCASTFSHTSWAGLFLLRVCHQQDCAVSWKESLRKLRSHREQLAPAACWPLCGIQSVFKSFVSPQLWETKNQRFTAHAMELLLTPGLVASPGAGAARPGTAARRRQQSLHSGISESVTGRPTPFPRCLTSVYFV